MKIEALLSKMGSRLSIYLVLICALVHGLGYVFLVPPWQHYDEPNHFEVAWLIANRGGLPALGEYDQEMRRQVAVSMIGHGFFRDLDFVPDLYPSQGAIWIGEYHQGDEPPLYYLLASLVLKVLRSQPIEVQLYGVRIFSLLLFVITVIAAWGLSGELTGAGHPLRWMVPLTLALWPGVGDLMTSVNNDVLAVVSFSLFLWGSVCLLRPTVSGRWVGANFWTLLGTLAATGLCLMAKETVYIAAPLLVIVLIFAFLQRGIGRGLAWGILGVGALLALLAIFDWGDAQTWYRNTDQIPTTRELNPIAPLGDAVFRLEISAEQSAGMEGLYQALPSAKIRQRGGQAVTLGAWMWASQPLELALPALTVYDQDGNVFQAVQKVWVGTKPAFYAFRASFPNEAVRGWVTVSSLAEVSVTPVTIYLDGLVLAEGEFPLNQHPQWDDVDGRSGTWGGQAFTNLLRNASAEQAGLRLRPWVDCWGVRLLPDRGRPSLVLYSLTDWMGTGWYYRAAFPHLFRTFTARFGWGQVPLLGREPYRYLAITVLLGLLGSFLVRWHEVRHWPWEKLGLLGLSMVLLWGMALARGAVYLFHQPYIPVARYALPSIIPTLMLLCLGWYRLGSCLGRLLCIPNKFGYLIYPALLAGWDVFSWISLWRYYHG